MIRVFGCLRSGRFLSRFVRLGGVDRVSGLGCCCPWVVKESVGWAVGSY